jgi:hypothetical protein
VLAGEESIGQKHERFLKKVSMRRALTDKNKRKPLKSVRKKSSNGQK